MLSVAPLCKRTGWELELRPAGLVGWFVFKPQMTFGISLARMRMGWVAMAAGSLLHSPGGLQSLFP